LGIAVEVSEYVGGLETVAGYPADGEEFASAIDANIAFNFRNINFLMYVDNRMMLPIGMDKVMAIINPETLNTELKMKAMSGLLEVADFNLVGMGIQPETDLQAKIKDAQSRLYDSSDIYHKNSFQLPEYETANGVPQWGEPDEEKAKAQITKLQLGNAH